MKIKGRIIYTIFMIIISIFFICLSMVDNLETNKAYILGFGTGLFTVSVIMLIKHIILLRNPAKMKEQLIKENDERNIKIINTSYALTFRITITIEAIICMIFVMLNKIDASSLIAFILIIQLLCLQIIYIVFSRKI